jgi:protein SCO1/2
MAASAKVERLLIVILVALLAAIAILLLTRGGTSSAPAKPIAKSPFDGPTMAPGLRAKTFSLTDQNGHRVTLSQYRGKVVVLTFIHSLCHDTCPFMVEQIKGALNELPDNGHGIATIGVSVDPSQDTIANRRAFLARHEMTGRMEFVNGSMPTMRRVWHEYAIQPVTPKVDHSAFVLLINKRGFERVGYAADQLTPEDLAHDIRVLERQPA